MIKIDGIIYNHLIYGDDSSDEDYDDDIDVAAGEIVEHKLETDERGIRAVGAIITKSSIDSTEKVLYFATKLPNVLDHIYKQLLHVKGLKSCPSWIDAFVTTQSHIK